MRKGWYIIAFILGLSALILTWPVLGSVASGLHINLVFINKFNPIFIGVIFWGITLPLFLVFSFVARTKAKPVDRKNQFVVYLLAFYSLGVACFLLLLWRLNTCPSPQPPPPANLGEGAYYCVNGRWVWAIQ